MKAQQLVLFPYMWQLTLTDAKSEINIYDEIDQNDSNAINQLRLEFKY